MNIFLIDFTNLINFIEENKTFEDWLIFLLYYNSDQNSNNQLASKI